ncbi:putative carboxy-muconate cyclase [Diaporthe ampelina]|uniref:Putative carboxy-muconate cyclase n=1 Tax=Diaporthe ampelina TaxID=1214573 RepID=A0A0G2FCQ1_9PEZI|nr:putative carboxy-muconate cyclase [Diaporthe ampelina]
MTSARLSEERCGPIRGAFYTAGGQRPTRYFALCQATKELLSFEVDFSMGKFTLLQRLQASVDTNGDKRSVADPLLQTNSDRSADIYLTNTFVGNDSGTGTISHFQLPAPEDDESTVAGDLAHITADRVVSSGGVNPNSICLDLEAE